MPNKYWLCEECCQYMKGEASSVLSWWFGSFWERVQFICNTQYVGGSQNREASSFLETSFYSIVSLLKCFEFLEFLISQIQFSHYRMHFLKPSALGGSVF